MDTTRLGVRCCMDAHYDLLVGIYGIIGLRSYWQHFPLSVVVCCTMDHQCPLELFVLPQPSARMGTPGHSSCISFCGNVGHSKSPQYNRGFHTLVIALPVVVMYCHLFECVYCYKEWLSVKQICPGPYRTPCNPYLCAQNKDK